MDVSRRSCDARCEFHHGEVSERLECCREPRVKPANFAKVLIKP